MNKSQNHNIRSKFKDSTVIFMVVHYNFECVRLTLLNILSIIDQLEDTYLILINSKASSKIINLLDKIQSKKVDRIDLPINFGFNDSINHYIKDFINEKNLPKTVVQMGSDILFAKDDFTKLIDAICDLKKYGTLSLSYENNSCNPERNALKPKSVKAENGKPYELRHTFLCPVPGGIMGIRGEILKDDLKFQFFDPKKLPKRYLRVAAVGGADASLYNSLKWKYKTAFLANTKALHMKTRSGDVIDLPESWNNYVNNLVENEDKILSSVFQ